MSQYNMMAAMFTVPINNPVGFHLFSYVATITDKSFGTLKHFWGIFQLTQAQPLPSLYRVMGGRTARKFPKRMQCCFMREPRMTEKSEYCITVPRNFVQDNVG